MENIIIRPVVLSPEKVCLTAWPPVLLAHALEENTEKEIAVFRTGREAIAVTRGGVAYYGKVTRVAEWLRGQSAGQCGPCVFGLGALVDDFARMTVGDPGGWYDAQRHLGLVPGRGACAHPDGTARFLTSALEVFEDDVRRHLNHDGCGKPVRGVLPVPGGQW